MLITHRWIEREKKIAGSECDYGALFSDSESRIFLKYEIIIRLFTVRISMIRVVLAFICCFWNSIWLSLSAAFSGFELKKHKKIHNKHQNNEKYKLFYLYHRLPSACDKITHQDWANISARTFMFRYCTTAAHINHTDV